MDVSGDLGGYADRSVVISGDGAYLFYAGQKILATNLASTLGNFSENIYAANEDGSVAIGSEHIFDGVTFSVIRALPISTTKMVLSADGQTLYLYDDMTSRIFIYSLADL